MLQCTEHILFKNFIAVRNKGWIETKRKGPTGVGYTLETLLSIPENSFAIPDFNDIEVKAMRVFSKKRIHLFNAEPDGDYLYPHERIINTIGYPCKKNPRYKVFMSAAYGNEYTDLGYSKKLKIYVNWDSEKVEFLVTDKHYNNVKIDISWSFALLKSKLDTKIRKLALISALNKFENGKEYFYYNWIEFYENKGFDAFLHLIEDGTIKICFKIGVYTEGIKTGKIDNHGTDFSLKEEDLEKLFTKINIFKK